MASASGVLLARAICQEPNVLLLDEPTSFLDVHHKIRFLEILRRLATERGIAVVLSMHELEFVERSPMRWPVSRRAAF